MAWLSVLLWQVLENGWGAHAGSVGVASNVQSILPQFAAYGFPLLELLLDQPLPMLLEWQPAAAPVAAQRAETLLQCDGLAPTNTKPELVGGEVWSTSVGQANQLNQCPKAKPRPVSQGFTLGRFCMFVWSRSQATSTSCLQQRYRLTWLGTK